jgi:hypothetical protein
MTKQQIGFVTQNAQKCEEDITLPEGTLPCLENIQIAQLPCGGILLKQNDSIIVIHNLQDIAVLMQLCANELGIEFKTTNEPE